MPSLKIASAQINTTPCDVAGNVTKIIDYWEQAEADGADLVITPEQSITGYPLMDKAANPDLLDAGKAGLDHLIEKSKSMESGIIVGINDADEDGNVYNSAYLLHKGTISGPYQKRHLPNYDVFDEKRIYTAGTPSQPVTFKGYKLGIMICEDLWHEYVAAVR